MSSVSCQICRPRRAGPPHLVHGWNSVDHSPILQCWVSAWSPLSSSALGATRENTQDTPVSQGSWRLRRGGEAMPTRAASDTHYLSCTQSNGERAQPFQARTVADVGGLQYYKIAGESNERSGRPSFRTTFPGSPCEPLFATNTRHAK